MPGDIFGCCNWRDPIGSLVDRGQGAAKHPTMHKIATYKQKIIWLQILIVLQWGNFGV